MLAAMPGRNGRLAASPGVSGTAGRLTSPSGAFWLTIQTDGNLVLYRGDCAGSPNAGCSVWSSRSFGAVGDYYLAVQDDGNLVVYRGRASAGADSTPNAVWSSRSSRGRGSYFLSVQDDGNVVMWEGAGLADRRGVVWSLQPVHGRPPPANPSPGPGREPVPAAADVFLGDWMGAVQCADPAGLAQTFNLVIWREGDQLLWTDYTVVSIAPVKFSDDGRVYRLIATGKDAEARQIRYVWTIDKAQAKFPLMQGEARTDPYPPCRRFLYVGMTRWLQCQTGGPPPQGRRPRME